MPCRAHTEDLAGRNSSARDTLRVSAMTWSSSSSQAPGAVLPRQAQRSRLEVSRDRIACRVLGQQLRHDEAPEPARGSRHLTALATRLTTRRSTTSTYDLGCKQRRLRTLILSKTQLLACIRPHARPKAGDFPRCLSPSDFFVLGLLGLVRASSCPRSTRSLTRRLKTE